MDFNFYHKYDGIPKDEWETFSNNGLFLSKDFLKTFEYKMDDKFSSVYIVAKIESRVVGIVYAQIFKLNSKKINEYIKHGNPRLTLLNRFKLILSKLLNFKVCFLGNLFMSNVSSFYFNIRLKPSDLSKILQQLSNFSGTRFIMIPEFFKNFIPLNSWNFKSLYVEPDMCMQISPKWNHFDDYVNDIQSKYKKKLRKVLYNSTNLEIRELEMEDLKLYHKQINKLFDNVFYNSSFNALKFKTYFLTLLIKNKINISVQGYFIENELHAFSSSIVYKNKLYVYFMGLNYALNKVYDIYSKMLYDKIKYAINHRLDEIKFGRTASEFKSNFGAQPVYNRAYIYSNSNLLIMIISPFINLIKPKNWIQRNPFK